MKIFALGLIGAGFLMAALFSVQEAGNVVAWGKFSAGLLIGGVGVVLLRGIRRSKTLAGGTGAASPARLAETVGRIVSNLATMRVEKGTIQAIQVHFQIDRLFRADLDAFAAFRECISDSYGLAAYAAVMNEFAAGERYLNRVWSASVDGYADEVLEYLRKAKIQFEKTESVLKGYVIPASEDMGGSAGPTDP